MVMNASTHFDRRGAAYDASLTHRRIVATLIDGAGLEPGMRVLDLGTGTGACALRAAAIVGPQGSVLGIDLSEGMLAEARRKLASAGLLNVEFLLADAEGIDLRSESFDCILCASALVMMQDIPAALRRWSGWLRPSGSIAFDMPAKPFGVAQWIAEAAADHSVLLPYDHAADTPEKCRGLLQQAGIEVTAVTTEVVSDEPLELTQAIAFLEERLDHPGWRALQACSPETLESIRRDYAERIAQIEQAGRSPDSLSSRTPGLVPNRVAQNFAYGRKP